MNPKSNTRVMRIYKQYFDMIKDGSKTVEIRVAYPSMKSITVGTIIRFNDDPSCVRRVKRVANYKSFGEMMSKEDPKTLNPHRTADEQLSDIRKIFPPDKERIGVIAFELEKV